MDLGLFARGVIFGLGAAVPIGPVNVEIARRTLRAGFRSGFFLGCGAVTIDVTYAILPVHVGVLVRRLAPGGGHDRSRPGARPADHLRRRFRRYDRVGCLLHEPAQPGRTTAAALWLVLDDEFGGALLLWFAGVLLLKSVQRLYDQPP